MPNLYRNSASKCEDAINQLESLTLQAKQVCGKLHSALHPGMKLAVCSLPAWSKASAGIMLHCFDEVQSTDGHTFDTQSLPASISIAS